MRTLSMTALAFAMACATTTTDTTTDDTGSSGDTGDSGTDTVSATISFDAAVNGASVACGGSYDVGTPATSATLKDFRLFVHDIELLTADGDRVPVTLDATSPWVEATTALLDFEDGSAACAEFGTPQMNTSLDVEVPAGTYTGIAFTIGVPHELNHAPTTTAPAPLDTAGMFWVWKSGHKYVRVDWVVPGDTPTGWNVHVGAGGCVSDDAMTAPETPCSKPNLSTVELTGLDPLTDTIVFDAGTLVATANLSTDTAETPPGCMANPGDTAECAPVFTAMGMDFATGACVTDCDGQTFVSVE